VKTTIEIPDPLYRQAKIQAVRNGVTLKALVLAGLEHELGLAKGSPESQRPYFARRELLPEFRRLQAAGAFQGGRDSTEMISEDRDAR